MSALVLTAVCFLYILYTQFANSPSSSSFKNVILSAFSSYSFAKPLWKLLLASEQEKAGNCAGVLERLVAPAYSYS